MQIKGFIIKKNFNTNQKKTINKYLGDYINAKKNFKKFFSMIYKILIILSPFSKTFFI